MVLAPFRNRNSQKLVSFLVMILGVLLILANPILRLGSVFTISGFAGGAVIVVIGLVYFLDVQ